ncbi:Ku domain protein [Mycobacterium phage WXIN]|nr:Ku domain protein [Mycobacterium phage WXIN]
MRSIWNGSVSFGMVNVPVKIYSATEDHDLKANQVHAHDHGRIKYAKVCATCNESVGSADIAKMYEVDGQVAILTEDDLSTLAAEKNRVMEVVEFVPASALDPMMYDKAYYLGPDGPAVKAYALLARTLAQSDRVAIVRFTMRSKSRLAALRVTGKNEVLTVHTLLWPDEIREPEFPALDNKPQLSEVELKTAASVVDSMSRQASNLDGYRDEYREELRELVMSKLEDAPEAPADTAEVSDLLAKLEASIKAPRQCKPPIREWAKREGITLGSRGRIPKDIVDQYEMAPA